MELFREATQHLVRWKDSTNRKPLLLQGARQVGKTWLLRQFGKAYFADTAYFNFEQQPALAQFFATTKNPVIILQNLGAVHGRAIVPGNTLLIFDEIQECTEALNALKYFCELAPEYAVAAAGSLLGVALGRGASFPVGKVDFLTIRPLTFAEYVQAADPALHRYLQSVEAPEPVPDIFFHALSNLLKQYFVCGGMPEAAGAMLHGGNTNEVQQVLQNILQAYSLDFSKHIDRKDVARVTHIWQSLPGQLARDNRKFLYQSVKQGARAREYEDALLWLVNAGLAVKVLCATKPALPLAAYDDLGAFKMYLCDVGLLRRLAGLMPTALMEGNRLFVEFKGALSENFVLQSLLSQFEAVPRYWRSERLAEVDFLFQWQNTLLPVEVKWDENVRSRSLTFFRNQFHPPLSIRYSMKNLEYNHGLLNIPLFMADYTDRLVQWVVDKQG
jgi:predicted AAA+ superfamily ATPase